MRRVVILLLKFMATVLLLILLYIGFTKWKASEANKQATEACAIFKVGEQFELVANKLDKSSSVSKEGELIRHLYQFAIPTALSSTECRIYTDNNGIVVKTEVRLFNSEN